MTESSSASAAWGGTIKSNAAGFAVAAAIVIVLSSLLYARVALTEQPLARVPLTVATVSYVHGNSHQRAASYLGLVVAGRKANLGFEIAGQIASLPLRQGSHVQRGDLIAALDDAALQARRKAIAADLEGARTELELAQLRAQRQRDLQATGAVSKEAFDETRLRARALESQLEATRARLASVDIELTKSRLTAPYDGVIADRYVYEGAVVNPGAPVVRLMETSGQEAHIGIAATRAGTLRVGEDYALELRDRTIAARLLAVRPDVDPVTRATMAVFAIPPETVALDGEPVTLELEETIPVAGGWLPIAALLEGQRGVWTVLRLQPEGNDYRTLREAVQVLDIQGDQAYVSGTLPDRATVVSSGVHRIIPGSLVRVQGSH